MSDKDLRASPVEASPAGNDLDTPFYEAQELLDQHACDEIRAVDEVVAEAAAELKQKGEL